MGFLEIMMVLVVILIVLTPKQLIQMAHGFGRIYRYWIQLKEHLDQEFEQQCKEHQLQENIARAKKIEASLLPKQEKDDSQPRVDKIYN